MPCRVIKHYPGVVGLACGPGAKPKPCAFCPRTSSLLCDGPTPGGKTCDKPICDRCAWRPERDVDFCPACAPMAKAARDEARLDIGPMERP